MGEESGRSLGEGKSTTKIYCMKKINRNNVKRGDLTRIIFILTSFP